MINYKTNIYFKDIYGMDDVKVQLGEIIDYLKGNVRYKNIGARLRKGVLLYGPSGTGKTMLAKAVAGESDANFIYKSAPEFVDKYVGVGADRVRSLFELAESMTPCIIFIDEIDALGKRMKHKSGLNYNYSMDMTNTINQLLSELDGFKHRENIVVIAATNNQQNVDPSLIRAGRFDLRIRTKLPDFGIRKGILQIKAKRVKNNISEDVFNFLSENTEGYSGADLEAMINESSYIALRNSKEIVDDESIKKALDFMKDNFEIKDDL